MQMQKLLQKWSCDILLLRARCSMEGKIFDAEQIHNVK